MKPVAWMDDHGCLENHLYQWMIDEGGWFPLYTAPRDLSDEEIMKEWHWKYADTYKDALIEFAKAILKKASEK